MRRRVFVFFTFIRHNLLTDINCRRVRNWLNDQGFSAILERAYPECGKVDAEWVM